MKRSMPLVALAFAFATNVLMAADKLVVAQDKALDLFKDDQELAAFYTAITGFTVVKSEDATKGNVVVNYRNGSDAATKSYEVALNDCAVTDPGQTDFPQTWGVKELRIARNFALAEFKTLSAEDHANVVSVTVLRSAGGAGGRVRLTFKRGEEVQTKTYFCHVHEGEGIDCH